MHSMDFLINKRKHNRSCSTDKWVGGPDHRPVQGSWGSTQLSSCPKQGGTFLCPGLSLAPSNSGLGGRGSTLTGGCGQLEVGKTQREMGTGQAAKAAPSIAPPSPAPR